MTATDCSTVSRSYGRNLRCRHRFLYLLGAFLLGCPLLSHDISGTVSGATGATITLSGSRSQTTVSDASGRYTFTDLPPGDYVLTPSLDGFLFTPDSKPVKLLNRDVTNVDFVASRLYAISGTVRGSAWSGVEIELSGSASQRTSTDLAGNYRFTSLPSGSYQLTATRAGHSFSPKTRTVTVSDTDLSEQDFSSTLSCRGDWCWIHPLTGGHGLLAAWSAGPNDAWLVGARGTALHWDGSRWSTTESGSTSGLKAIWGSGPYDLWAVGEAGTILHWNGYSWTSMASGTTDDLSVVWGSSATDVWAAGSAIGLILHWNGDSWSAVGSNGTAAILKLWGSGPEDAWAAGADGTIIHWDGTQWVPVPSGMSYPLTSVFVIGPDDVWAAGEGGAFVHWNGTEWLPVHSPTTGTILDLWGSRTDDVWATDGSQLLHWDGVGWSIQYQETSGGSIYKLWGSGSNDVWSAVTGSAVPLLHWDGTAWSPQDGSVVVSHPVFFFGTSSGVCMADNAGQVLHWNGQSWLSNGLAHGRSFIWGAGPEDIWIASGRTLLHWDGATLAPFETGLASDFIAIGGSGPNDVWAITRDTTIVAWDGANWRTTYLSSTTPSEEPIIWGSSSNDIWAVQRSFCTPSHWDGNEWATHETGWPGHCRDIWGTGPNDVWMLGHAYFQMSVLSYVASFIHHWDGNGWGVAHEIDSGCHWDFGCVVDLFRGIRGTGPNDVWFEIYTEDWHGTSANHLSGFLHLYDGWNYVGPEMADVMGIFRGTGPNDTWSRNDQGAIIHWDGASWTTISEGLPIGAGGFNYWGTSEEVWAVGPNGWILRWQPTQ